MTPPRRVFLSWDQPALPAAARILADRHATARTLSLDEVTVATPGARAGRRLVELLVEEADARDLVLSPPRTTTVGALPEQLYEPELPVAEQPLSLRVWSRCLRELDPERRDRIFPEPPAPGHLHRWDRLARLVHRLHRDTAGEGLDFAEVADSFRGRPGYDDSGRWRALAVAQEAYRTRLRELGYTDRDSARLRALERAAVSTDHRIYLLGVVEMAGVIRRMLQSLAAPAPVSALVHAPESRADAFDPLGCVRPEVWAEEEIGIDDDALVQCGRPPSQADAALRALAGEGRPLGPDEITVGVPDEEVIPFLMQRLEAHDVPHRYAGGTPLPRTESFRLLSTAAEQLEGGRFQDLAALLRHPRVERRVGVADPLERADRYFERHLPARVGPGDGTGRGSSRRARDFQELLGRLQEELELDRFRRPRPLGEWMPEILAFLERVYGDERLDRSRQQPRRLAEALEAVVEAAARLHRLPAGAQERCDGATAIRLLLSQLRDSAIPPVPERSAVELLGWLELHLDDAPVLILTGFNEGKVPASVNADLFLPDTLRRDLGLPHNESRYARDAYLLTATLACREEATILLGRRDLEGNPLRPSRLLLATDGRELASRARRLFAEESAERPPVRRLGLETYGPSEFRSPPEPVIHIPRVPDTLRVTEFRLLLEDPYRWALERQLELEAQHDRDRELDGAAFGGLAHEVLHKFGRHARARSSSDPDRVAERLSLILDEVAERRFAGRALPAVQLQVEQLRVRLRQFAAWQAGRVSAGWEMVAAEVPTPEGGIPFDVDGAPVRLTGRVDRIDRHRESGRWAVLDYKTSERPRSPDDRHRAGRAGDRRWVDLQLPLYRHLLPGIAAVRTAPEEAPRGGTDTSSAGASLSDLAAPDAEVELGYVNLSREGVTLSMADWSAEELAEADQAAREAVRTLRRGIVEFRPGAGPSYREDPFAPLLGRRHLPASHPPGDGTVGSAG